MKNVIISSFPGSEVEFNPNVIFHPAVARIVQDHYMSRYQQAWISCINKEFNPNLPNKLKSYASFKNHLFNGELCLISANKQTAILHKIKC